MARVFVVEDAALQRTIIERFVRSEYTVVETEADGETAVGRIKELEPDVVIMDINLPSLDGISATEAIKTHNSETGIIVSTAVVNHEARAMADEIPIEDYLIKPYSKQELLEAIDKAVD